MHLGFTSDACFEQANFCFCISDNFNPDFVIECTHNYLAHLEVTLSIAPIVSRGLFLNRSVQNLHLAAFRSDGISI
jgi:hypothetical protein